MCSSDLLFAHPLKIRVLIFGQRIEKRREQAIVLLQRFENSVGGQVQLRQPAPVVLHLFNKVWERFSTGEDPSGRAGRDCRKRRPLFGFEFQLAEAAEKPALDGVRVGLQKHSEPLQMFA